MGGTLFFLVNAISKNEANVCENEHIEGNIPFYCRLFRSKIGFNKKNGVLFEDLLNACGCRNCFIDLLLDGEGIRVNLMKLRLKLN